MKIFRRRANHIRDICNRKVGDNLEPLFFIEKVFNFLLNRNDKQLKDCTPIRNIEMKSAIVFSYD